ncbi:MAG: phosphate ABC transporter permease subunit PstC [Parvularculales bacterium]
MLASVSSFSGLLICLLLITIGAYWISRRRITALSAAQSEKPHSLAVYYSFYAAIWTFAPAILLLLCITAFTKPILEQQIYQSLMIALPDLPASFIDLKVAQIENLANGVLTSDDEAMLALAAEHKQARANMSNIRFALVLLLALFGFGYAFWRLAPKLKTRIIFETFLKRVFFLAAALAILTTVGIIASLLFEAMRFFSAYSWIDFFFGTHWAPNIALRGAAADEDVGGASGSYGMIPVMAGTLLVAAIAMLVAVPVGLFAAIYMAEFASSRVRDFVKPTLEILAGIPTVVYGFFAALTAAPFFRSIGLNLGMDVSAQSALAAGGVMGVMIIPFISSLSDDVITAVPQSLRDGAYGLGSTKGEIVTRVVLPAALPGLVGAFLLGISRAIGETMIVVMAAGVSANLTANPLESVTTVTVQIVLLLTGDTVFDSPKTLSAFALGITLFAVTLLLNIAALTTARRLGEKYD